MDTDHVPISARNMLDWLGLGGTRVFLSSSCGGRGVFLLFNNNNNDLLLRGLLGGGRGGVDALLAAEEL
jgi:hypothetical protein